MHASSADCSSSGPSSGLSRALSWLRLLPAWLTDLPYRLEARTRYRVFGKYDTCPMAPLEHRTRFLP